MISTVTETYSVAFSSIALETKLRKTGKLLKHRSVESDFLEEKIRIKLKTTHIYNSFIFTVDIIVTLLSVKVFYFISKQNLLLQ